ncbi:hypothetical protein [Maribacter sp. 2304DJ31-5]|uniref:hypothetical protein n=1 Tax=Maribacter sp. 2304DJ31-5 TaxID=3386273 RepID=UPI0039BC861B
MKIALYILVCSLSYISSNAQVKSLELSHYVFPDFIHGDVLMKNGNKYKAWLNYSAMLEEMVFEDGGKRLAINEEQLELIDTIYIKGRKFFTSNNKFLELLNRSKFDFYAEYKYHIKSPAAISGPGRTSQTVHNTSYSTLNASNMGSLMYDLVLPDDYKVKPYTYYWLKKNGKLSKFKNLKQLIKFYSIRKSLCKEYIKTHDIEFNDQKSIVQLIRYMEVD